MSALRKLIGNQEFIKKVPVDIESYSSGDEIIKEYDDGRDVYLILSGQAQVHTSLTDKNSKMSPGMGRLGEGELFGELSLFDGQPRSAHIRALNDCEVAKLNGVALLKFMDEHPEKGYLILKEIFEHLVKHMRQNSILSKSVLQLYLIENS